jgi:hypothetical protein
MTDIRPRLRALAPWLGPLLVVVALFPDVLFGGRVFFDRDIGAYWLPHAATFVRILAQGSWPLWNPYEGFGLPFLADPSLQVAYPTTWLNVVLAPPTVYKVLLLGHAVLAGAGVVALGRRWGMSGLAASLAGTAWCASGPFLSAGSLHQHFCGAAWIAWVLLALESALADPGRRAAARLGAVAAVEALTGSADICLLTAVAAAGRISFWWAAESRTARRAPRIHSARIHFARATTLAGAAALAFALAAIQWIPSAALLKSVERSRLGPGEILYWSVHPFSLIDLFVPRFFADLPLSLELRGRLFEGREPFLVSLYVGLASLGLVILVRPRGWEPRTYVATMAVLFGLASLGRHVLLFPLLLTTPPFSLSRYPAKYTLPFAMFWALLAGFGLDAWRRPWNVAERRRGMAALAIMAALAMAAGAGALWVGRDVQPPMRLLQIPPEVPAETSYLLTTKLNRTALVALAAALLLAFRLRRQAVGTPLALAMAMLAAADLATAGRDVNPVAPPELLAHRPRTLDLLGADVADHRLLSPAAELPWLNAHFVRGVAGWDRRASWALGMQDILAAPIGARWGIRGSYDSDVTGLATPAFHFMAGALLRNRSTPVAPKLLRMGNVGYVIVVQEDGVSGLSEVGQVATIFDRPARVMRVGDPLPPAWVVGGSRPADSPTAALLAIAEPDFDPVAEVVLGDGGRRVPPPSDFRARCTIRERRADRLVVDMDANAGGHLVVAEAYEDGWKATLDGSEVPVRPANVLFRAVAVPAGSHRVELRYRPAAVYWGAALTATGLVALAALLVRRER